MQVNMRAVIVGIAACLAAMGPVLTSERALAGAPPGSCQGKSEESVVKAYTRGILAIPLRCGTLTYGFTHIVDRGRWNDVFDSDIALTIARGEENGDGSIYAWFDDRCVEQFRVVVNQGPIGGSGFRPQGVITAYARTYPTTIAYRTAYGRPDSASTAATRTDCPIYVPVNDG
jgi:hypothetical protein